MEGGGNVAQEKTFENKVKGFLKDHGCWFIKYWAGAEFTKTGIPDILACVNGVFFGIEVKAPRGRPSPLQLYNLKKIDSSGGRAILLYPNQFDQFKALVENTLIGDTSEADKNYLRLCERWWDDANVTQ